MSQQIGALGEGECNRLRQTGGQEADAHEVLKEGRGKMRARVSEIRSHGKVQATPAPLLQTRRGQLPNLPSQLATQAIPANETLLLQFALCDWHMLNANARQLTTDVLPALARLPKGEPTAATLTGQLTSILFLTARAAASTQTLTNTPGKSLSVRVDSHSATSSVSPLQSARLHAVLATDFAVAPTDGVPVRPHSSANVLRKRAYRSVEQVRAFVSGVEHSATVFASVQGGVDNALRKLCASGVCGDNIGGICIDGLYAGESAEERERAIDSCVVVAAAQCDGRLRMVSGGGGYPWDVLRAVRLGVDIVESCYPFEMAEDALATRLCVGDDGRAVNVRDRRWERFDGGLVEGCECFACRGFSRAYVRHLFEVHEMMGVTLVAAHNLFDYLRWFGELRHAIRHARFESFVRRFEERRRVF